MILKRISCDDCEAQADTIERSSSQAGVDVSTMLTIAASAFRWQLPRRWMQAIGPL
jgi:hypothetical protein